METRGIINTKNPPDLGHFCRVMAENLGALIGHISPKITARDISELSLLTLGAQLYGSNNNTIGKQATLDVFLSVTEIVKKYIVSKDSTKIIVTNASKRKVIIALAADPAPLPCASETAYRKCDECVDDRFCGTKMVMREVRDAMAGILDNVTLAQVCQRMDDARAKVDVEAGEALMYYI